MEDESIVDVQLAYLEQLKGNLCGSEGVRGDLETKTHGQDSGAVASNNIVTIHGDSDLFDSYRKAKVALNAESKLTSDQREIMTFNFCLLLIKMGRLKEARDLIRKLQDKERVSILNVALLVRGVRAWSSRNKLPQISIYPFFVFLLCHSRISLVSLTPRKTITRKSTLECKRRM